MKLTRVLDDPWMFGRPCTVYEYESAGNYVTIADWGIYIMIYQDGRIERASCGEKVEGGLLAAQLRVMERLGA